MQPEHGETQPIETLVVTDLDGTLWDHDLVCHPRVLDAFGQVQRAEGIDVLVATGRRRNSAYRGLSSNGLMAPAVLLNGAVGWDFVTGAGFHEICFGPGELDLIWSGLDSVGVQPVAYLADHRAVAVEGVTTSPAHLNALGSDLVWMPADELRTRSDVLMLSALGVDRELVEPAASSLSATTRAVVAAYPDPLFPPFGLMLAPPGVDKAAGIGAWLTTAGLSPQRIIALGDAANDLAMLDMADVALVVAGGDPQALELADATIPRPEAGGWSAVLDWL